MTDDRPLGYWEDLAEEAPEPAEGVDSEDLSMSVVELVEERTDDMWSVDSILLSDRGDDGTMYLLIVRHGVGDNGSLLLDERYFSVDPRDPFAEGSGYSQNGITRTVSGEGMMRGLKVAYSAVSDSLESDLGGPVMEAQNGGLDHRPETLLEPLETLLKTEEEDSEEDSEESAEDSPEPAEPVAKDGWARCKRCGEEVRTDRDDVTEFSSGPPLGDVYIHSGGCPEEETDE